MSVGSFKQSRVQCPFYRDDAPKSKTGDWAYIKCEGICNESTLKQIFKTTKSYNQYIDFFCCHYYHECPIAKMLMETKYKGEILP